MRACILTADLGRVAERKGALLAEVAAFTGQQVAIEAAFVGLRQGRPVPEGIVAFQPYVPPEHYTRTRITNAALHLADAGLVPRSMARPTLSIAAGAIVEAILACDPEVVLLDVKWGGYLKPMLAAEFSGNIYVSRESCRPAGHALPRQDTPPPAKVSIVLPTHNGST